MAWLMQLMMFLLLGLLARPTLMLPVLLPALAIGAFLFFIARPTAVMVTLLPFRNMSFRGSRSAHQLRSFVPRLIRTFSGCQQLKSHGISSGFLPEGSTYPFRPAAS